jgi:hypothetical protein
MSNGGDSSKKVESDSALHFGLIEMAFALAIGEVAGKLGDYIDDTIKYDPSKMCADHIPFFTQLLLATLLVACSWIYWGKRFRHGGPPIDSVFEWQFLELLVDLTLVILYFVFIHAASVPPAKGPADLSLHLATVPALMSGIFLLYALWDLITKPFNTYKSRSISTGICFALSLCLCGLGHWKLSGGATPLGVVCLDLSYCALVFLFRALKREDLAIGDSAAWGRVLRFPGCWGSAVVLLLGVIGVFLFRA